jgi:hypothetical protein
MIANKHSQNNNKKIPIKRKYSEKETYRLMNIVSLFSS